VSQRGVEVCPEMFSPPDHVIVRIQLIAHKWR
jgi:hypothetical protein